MMTRVGTAAAFLLVAMLAGGCGGALTQAGDDEEIEALTPTKWVSNAGNDSWPGTQAQPWKTLTKAAGSVAPGDVVQVLPGSYRGFDLRTAGTKAQPIVFRGRTGGGAWVIINQANPTTPDGINVENSGWVTIHGFQVDNMPRAGIRVAVSAHVTVRNCRTRNNQVWGIFSGFADYLTVVNNTCANSVEEHGIYVSNSGDWPIIRDNHCFGNRCQGIHMNGDASMGGDGVISHALVERNIIHDNGVGGGAGINCDGVTDSIIRNNLLYQNHATGIALYRIDGGSGSSRNKVVNNTVVQASDGRWCLLIVDGSQSNIVRNNILLHTHAYRGSIAIDTASQPGFSSDYNLVSGPFSRDGDATTLSFAQWKAAGQDLHSAIATAAQIFLDPLAANYRPKDPGPAIDAGEATYAPKLDLLKRARPQGAGVDVGCYEGP
jgi:parallel beta-helix repeat protein